MKSSLLPSFIAIVALQLLSVTAQTYSSCNPLQGGNCPPDSALGKAVNIDFTSGASDSFTPQGNPTYDSNGASFTVAKSGDSPQLTSKWYIMFGHVEFVLKPAPGRGIVSSAVMQSDDLDEIDWEWLGSDNQQVQSNYFGKGLTTTYNRGAFHSDPNNQGSFKTYTIDWTADQIAWQIDGTTVRTLTPQTAEQGQYPQTPMMIKVGAWSGGDSSNAQGTVQWAGGPTDYSAGPYTMQVKSIAVTDYSTGTKYTYSGTDGTWQSIQSDGKINSSGKGASPVAAVAPAITSSSNSAPMPFEGTHRSSSTYVKPDTYPWVASTLATSASTTATTYPGLPAGWTVTSSGKVLPPSAASQPSPAAKPTGSPEGSSPDSGSGSEVITTYDQRGFPVTLTVAAAQATAQKHFDDQGFLITSSAAAGAGSNGSPTQAAYRAEDSASATGPGVSVTSHGSGAAAASKVHDSAALFLAALGGLALGGFALLI